jgi:hypothetical protein
MVELFLVGCASLLKTSNGRFGDVEADEACAQHEVQGPDVPVPIGFRGFLYIVRNCVEIKQIMAWTQVGLVSCCPHPLPAVPRFVDSDDSLAIGPHSYVVILGCRRQVGDRGLAVPASTPDLLVVAVNGLRQARVHHTANIRNIHAEAKSGRSHDYVVHRGD